MDRRVFAVAIIAGVALLCAGPARANVTSVTIGPPTQSVSGTCPVTVKFTGTIGGAPGGVSYQFFGSGGAPNGPSLTATIPSSGSVTVSDTEQVASGHTGTWTRQLLAKQGNLMYSGSATYTATCTPPPSPGPSTPPGGGTSMPAPLNLTNTTDSHVCAQHIMPLICIGMAAGALTLVWDWHAGNGYSTLDGYNVYRVDHGMFSRVSHSSAGQDATGTLLNPISGGFDGTCYVVRAYKGSTESGSSNTFCVGGAGVVGPAVLYSTQWGWRYHNYEWHGIGSGNLPTWGLRCDDLCMGYIHHRYGSGPFGDDYETYWRSYLMFDPNQITQLNNRITKATLTVRVVSGNPGCFGGVGPATAQWSGNTSMIDGDFSYNVSPTVNSSGAVFDVSSIVKDWANGSLPNYGFAFRGTNESTGNSDDNSCILDLASSGVLTIQHF